MAASKPKYQLGSPQEHIEMCKTHHLPIDMMCEDCDEFICGKCAKTDHKDHEWYTIPAAATQRRRGLLKFLKKVKDDDLPVADKKIEKIPQQIKENKELCDSEIQKLQKHFDEVMARLTIIKKDQEQQFRDNLKKFNEDLDVAKSELNKTKKEIEEMVKFLEENKNTMSDYGFIDNHRNLTRLLSGLDVDMKCSTPSLRYIKGEVSYAALDNLIGKSINLDDICLTVTSSFEYGEKTVSLLRASCEDKCYIKQKFSEKIEQVNK
ncbi:E3 ubiquitin-protein ligase TRIM39-like [Saccostrea cucullata]|uniref:E3 ubiquitin-protein ligase TRIM39-like n=1 Tax=Saccostrea cuccullata TaxID=36930 RepID=UPI002ED5B8ED